MKKTLAAAGIVACLATGVAQARFVSTDPVKADPNTGQNFNRYSYANNNPYRFTDPDGRLSRGTGWTDRQWRNFDSAQQSAAGSLEKAAGRITNALESGRGLGRVERSFERTFGAGSATPENMAKAASDMGAMAAALRDTSPSAIPANGMSAQAMTAAFSNMTPSAMMGVPTTGPKQVIVNLDHAQLGNRNLVTWGVGHEMGHAVLGYKDQVFNGYPAYKFGSPDEQGSFRSLPGQQRLINPDHIMDFSR
ncbi:RHS repeat-associated core domain-containing protein [Luteimonas huabeiensis]|uniref:RHS repeat-associated core domain-containing protein n=1 Tax=Luteimonas huabeiensis TaxID=1244513 RepID=UPI0009E049AF|nr:RHS repeat-associated core domain-containing protein [Luteimonas huabeiensis]